MMAAFAPCCRPRMFSRCREKASPPSPLTPEARGLSGLVRVDQEFLAGSALGVDGEITEVERRLQRHPLGVVPGKGGLQLGDGALAELLATDRADLHQEREEQPAA